MSSSIYFRFSRWFLLIGFLFCPIEATTAMTSQTILFFGDSITAGYGLEPDEAFPALIQKKISDLGWPFRVVNAGVSGDTTAAGAARLDWSFREKPDVMVLALGANDGLRGVPPKTSAENLQKIIDKARKLRPGISILLCGMKMPPNYGPSFTEEFAAVFPELARKNKLVLVPFLLAEVGGVSEMNQADRIHPTAEGNKIIAETVWSKLKPVLELKMKEKK